MAKKDQPPKGPQAQILPPLPPVSAGEPAEFIDESTSSGGTIKSRVWDFGDNSGTLLTDKTTVLHMFDDPGTYDVVLTVTDQKGRTSTATATVVVETSVPEPTTPPTIACPGAQTGTSTDGQAVTVTFPDPVVSGGTPPLTVSVIPPSGSQFPVGTTIVFATVTDAENRTASCSFEVTMQDVSEPPEPPVDEVPLPVTSLTATASGTSVAVTWVPPASTQTEIHVIRNMVHVATTAKDGSRYDDVGLAPGDYSYRVDTANAVGIASSDFVTATVVAAPSGDTLFDQGIHPRLILTPDRVQTIRANVRPGGPQHDEFQQHLQFIDSRWSEFDASGADQRTALMQLGFILATYESGLATYGYSLEEYQSRFRTLFDAVLPQMTGSVEAGMYIALSYDWGFQTLTPSQVTAGVAALRSWVWSEAGTNFAHHIKRANRFVYITTGLAYAHDGTAEDTADAMAKVAIYPSLITPAPESALGGSNWLGPLGSYPDGFGYAHNRYSEGIYYEQLGAEAYRTAMNDSVTWTKGANTQVEYAPLLTLSLLEPYVENVSGQLQYHMNARTWQTAPQHLTHEVYQYTIGLAHYMMVGYYAQTHPEMAGLAKWLCTKALGVIPTGGTYPTSWRDSFNKFFSNTYVGVAERSPESLNLPLSQYFGPLGQVTMRTSWTFDETQTQVTLHASAYAYNNNGYNATGHGHFTISRGYPVVITPETGAHHQYGELGFGWNTVGFVDPDETAGSATSWWDYGFQRYAGSYPTPTTITDFTPGSAWDITSLKSAPDLYDGTPEHLYDHIYVDVTRAYNGPANNDGWNLAKVKNAERHLVFFRNPDRSKADLIVVYDRTESMGTNWQQRWVFHPAGRKDHQKTVTMEGHTLSAAGPTRSGSSAGKTTYDQPTGATLLAEQGAKTFWRCHLPDQRQVVEVWGPNAAGQWNVPDAHEFENPYGQNLQGSYSTSNDEPWCAGGHLEVIAKTPATVQNFLNTFEVAPRTGSETMITRVQTATMDGVVYGTSRAAFFKNSPGVANSGQILLPVAGMFDVLVTDLPASTLVAFQKGTAVTALAWITPEGKTTPHRTAWLRITVASSGYSSDNAVFW
jgi:PKD domain/HYR domain